MKKFKHLLVALDLSSVDEKLIQYTSFFAQYVKAKKIYFVHNIKRYDSDELLDQLVKPKAIQEQIQKQLIQNIKTNYTSKINYELIISDDPFTESFISYIASRFKIDLTILGKKNRTHSSGTLTGKVLRSLKSSVLLVPNDSEQSLKKILIGIDFSDISKQATRIAFKLSKKSSQIDFVYIYQVSSQYLSFIKEDKIITMTEQYADQKLEDFIKKANVNAAHSSFIKINRKESNISDCLQKVADKNNYDILIIGNKGQNWVSSFLIGSVAEKMYYTNTNTPVLIIK